MKIAHFPEEVISANPITLYIPAFRTEDQKSKSQALQGFDITLTLISILLCTYLMWTSDVLLSGTLAS